MFHVEQSCNVTHFTVSCIGIRQTAPALIAPENRGLRQVVIDLPVPVAIALDHKARMILNYLFAHDASPSVRLMTSTIDLPCSS